MERLSKESVLKKEERLCLICGQKAGFVYSPDLDLQGLGACEKHQGEVRTALEILFYLGEEDFEEFLAACRQGLVKT